MLLPMAPARDPMTPRVARVRKRRRDGPQVFTLDIELDTAEADDLAPFAPGQFNMLTAFGIGEEIIKITM